MPGLTSIRPELAISPVTKTSIVGSMVCNGASGKTGSRSARRETETKTVGEEAKAPASPSTRSCRICPTVRPRASTLPAKGKLNEPSGVTRTERLSCGSSTTSIWRTSPGRTA